MGRYGRELSARHEDPAGKYLDAARQRRKDHRSGQTRPEAPIEWPVADLTGGFDAEAVSRWLKELEAGGRLAFRGLEKEQRAVVHRLAHQLGFINTSKADPEGCSARMVCVLRPHTTSAQPPSAESASAEVAASSRETRSAFVAGPPTSPPARRWRRSAVKRGGAGVGQETPDARLPLPVSMPMQEVDEAPMTLGTLSKVTGSLCIVWLRDDLRLQDNEALLRSMSFSAVVPVFILEEPVVEAHGLRSLRGAARFWKHESLRVFSKTLASLGSGLILRVGGAVGAEAELLKIWQELGAPQDSTLAFNRRCERWQQSVDEQCSNACRRAGLKVESFPANVLYEPQDLQPIERWQRWRARVRAASGEAGGRQKGLEHLSGFGSYRFLAHALEELGLPAKPLAAVVRLPPLPVLRSEPLCVLGLGDTRGIGFTSCRRQSQPGAGSHRDWARGIRAWWRVGEEAAQERLKNFLEVLARGDFEGRKRLLSDEKNTSELSPYLRFGEISARFVYWAARSQCAQRTEQKIFQHSGYGYEQERPKANATFLRRFMWRDLAYWFLWEFPSLPHTSLRLQYEEQAWNGTDVELKKWQKGVTGFPLVDAAMRQLWHVGWMPNYVRHVVAQMLIEYLDISWKHGLDWFDWTLVDADVAINSFMWQNGGHSGPDQWEFVLHPVNAAKSCDPLGTYVRRWVPELRSCPAEWIHRPWEMPLGRRTWIYLEPMIKDLDEARRRHCRNVLEVRRRHPETIARNGHEWLKLPGRKGLLAKLVTRQEFRADTEDFIFYQSRPKGRFAKPKPKPLDDNQAVLAEHMEL